MAEGRLWAGACVLLLTTLLLTLTQTAWAQGCPVSYQSDSAAGSMLFNSVYSAECEDADCAARREDGSQVSKFCAFNEDSGPYKVICDAVQREAISGYLSRARGGELPSLTPCQLWPYIRSRTLWLVGDSHSKGLTMALGCFFSDFLTSREHFCNPTANQALVGEVLSAPTIMPVTGGVSQGREEVGCLHLMANTRICLLFTVLESLMTDNAKVPDGGILPLLQDQLGAQPHDIFLVNTAAWYMKARSSMVEYREELRRLARFYEATRSAFPHLFFWKSPAGHVGSPIEGTKEWQCELYSDVRYNPDSGAVSADGSGPNPLSKSPERSLQHYNDAAEAVLAGSGIPVLGSLSFNMSLALPHNHYSADCIHACFPGVPEVTVWEMFDAMRARQTGIKPLTGSRVAPVSESYACEKSATNFGFWH